MEIYRKETDRHYYPRIKSSHPKSLKDSASILQQYSVNKSFKGLHIKPYRFYLVIPPLGIR